VYIIRLLSLYHIYIFMIRLLVVWIMLKRLKKGRFKLRLRHQLEYIFLIIPICVIIILTKLRIPYLYRLCSVISSRILMIGFQWYWIINNKECFYRSNLSYLMRRNEIYIDRNSKRMRITGSANDVIHRIYIPRLYFKIDLVPGRLSNQVICRSEIVSYGVCAEICGANHAFIPFKYCTIP